MTNKSLKQLSPPIIRLLIRLQYEFVSALIPKRDLLFMNFGYADIDPGSLPLALAPQDEPDRYSLQLYDHLARRIDWTNARVLEVSCGRGGGAAYIMRYYKPAAYTGVDFSSNSLEFCRSHHRIPGLTFEHGNAENLRFADASFDVVLNVEASLYYPRIDRFFGHIKRILKPGGHFLYADLRFEEEQAAWLDKIHASGLELIHAGDITANVLKALELDRERRIRLVDTHAPAFLRNELYFLIGLVRHAPKSTPQLPNRRYRSFILRKAL